MMNDKPHMLSVIIPCLNAARTLPAVLSVFADFNDAQNSDAQDSAKNQSGDGLEIEILVVDGGSGDETEVIATHSSARIVHAPRGRGVQLETGGREAQGDWLLFLHADTMLSSNWAEEVQAFIADPRNLHRAAYFEYRLDATDKMARILEYAVRMRCRLFHLPYGDQGLLISRVFYDSLGGFRKIPLMEDVDMVRRIVKFANPKPLVPLPVQACTGAERYQRGYGRRIARNFLCLCLWGLGARPEFLAKLYR